MKQDYVRAKNQCEQNHWGKGIYTQKKKKNLTWPADTLGFPQLSW